MHSVSAGFRQISTSGSKNEQRAGSGCRLEVYRICSLRGRDAGKGGRGLRGPFAVLEEGRREGGGVPEVCGDRELFSPSVGCADSLLGRGSKGHRQCWAKRGERELRGPEVGRKRQETAGNSRKQQEAAGNSRKQQEAASPAARKCAAGLVGDILLTIRDGQEIRPCRPSRTAPSSP